MVKQAHTPACVRLQPGTPSCAYFPRRPKISPRLALFLPIGADRAEATVYRRPRCSPPPPPLGYHGAPDSGPPSGRRHWGGAPTARGPPCSPAVPPPSTAHPRLRSPSAVPPFPSSPRPSTSFSRFAPGALISPPATAHAFFAHPGRRPPGLPSPVCAAAARIPPPRIVTHLAGSAPQKRLALPRPPRLALGSFCPPWFQASHWVGPPNVRSCHHASPPVRAPLVLA